MIYFWVNESNATHKGLLGRIDGDSDAASDPDWSETDGSGSDDSSDGDSVRSDDSSDSPPPPPPSPPPPPVPEDWGDPLGRVGKAIKVLRFKTL